MISVYNFIILAEIILEKFDPKLVEALFSAAFSNVNKCRPEVAGDVISGVAVEIGRHGCPCKIG